jgi:hypothetical protein
MVESVDNYGREVWRIKTEEKGNSALELSHLMSAEVPR